MERKIFAFGIPHKRKTSINPLWLVGAGVGDDEFGLVGHVGVADADAQGGHVGIRP